MLREVSCYKQHLFQGLIFSPPASGDDWFLFCVIPDMPDRMIVLLTDERRQVIQ